MTFRLDIALLEQNAPVAPVIELCESLDEYAKEVTTYAIDLEDWMERGRNNSTLVFWRAWTQDKDSLKVLSSPYFEKMESSKKLEEFLTVVGQVLVARQKQGITQLCPSKP